MSEVSTSFEARNRLVETLQLDLVGPDNRHAFAAEVLPESPSRWYLTGYLVPVDAPEDQRFDEQSQEEIDSPAEAESGDDNEPTDRTAARRSYLPSSMGLTFLVPSASDELVVDVEWGDYSYTGVIEGEAEGTGEGGQEEDSSQRRGGHFRRIARHERVVASLKGQQPPDGFPVPNSAGLYVVLSVRPVRQNARIPAGTRSVSAFLVNRRRPHERHMYRSFVFQAYLQVGCTEGFVPRPDPRWTEIERQRRKVEWDDRVADLHYRDVFEFAVGHGTSTTWTLDPDRQCRAVGTAWIPSADVERVAAPSMSGVELGMEALANLASAEAAEASLSPLVSQYREWIDAQRKKLEGLEPGRKQTADDLLVEAAAQAQRIAAGIKTLQDPHVLTAFRLANRCMAIAARRREAQRTGRSIEEVGAPAWRPFQLAFILLSLRGLVDPRHADRESVDLLFFPTGGGKTEAYLGLAALSLVLRRLRHPGPRSGGITVLMRYTLRLLTLDQLGRAAALICALELEREKNPAVLGEWPFEIGLWVGSAATPNRMGYQGYNGPGAEYTAYKKVRAYQNNTSKASPIPLENCPWCDTRLVPRSFRLGPNPNKPENLSIICDNPRCEFTGNRHLPIVAVDEPIYRRLPAFLIATVDKFAALPWTGAVGSLFGHVTRVDKKGYYGPADEQAAGTDLGGPLPPPDLIIQDELHLISGPLGTIAGVYETALDVLASREHDGVVVRPKIIASTATVRRADSQIRALFGREQVNVFPAPGPDRRDSFFAKTIPAGESPGRRYVGIAAQGRSLKVVMLRACLALLSAGERLYRDAGGHRAGEKNPLDPYMTLLGYFNSLRELGGSRRIFEDEIKARLEQYGRRRRIEPEDRLFEKRVIDFDPVELTSRVSTTDVAGAKRRLGLAYSDKEAVDVALATNMISVGLDITRLGLMVVLGQPKSSAEYIQATSRVGRQVEKPGLVITLLNVHKPRDRSHYERFSTWHACFYRAVEASSVTPFSPRALDRALAGALVGLCRHGLPEMTAPLGAENVVSARGALDRFSAAFGRRAGSHRHLDAEEAKRLEQHVRDLAQRLLDEWVRICTRLRTTNTHLQYQRREVGNAAPLIRDFLDPELDQLPVEHAHFRAGRSMRDVEASTELFIKNLREWGN